MKFDPVITYLGLVSVLLFSWAQYADHKAAEHCSKVTAMSYNVCRQLKP